MSKVTNSELNSLCFDLNTKVMLKERSSIGQCGSERKNDNEVLFRQQTETQTLTRLSVCHHNYINNCDLYLVISKINMKNIHWNIFNIAYCRFLKRQLNAAMHIRRFSIDQLSERGLVDLIATALRVKADSQLACFNICVWTLRQRAGERARQ